MFKRNSTITSTDNTIEWLSKYKDAESSKHFYWFFGTFHVLPSAKIIFMFQSSIMFAYIVSNFPCSIYILLFFLLLCISTIYSFYTCDDYFLLPLISLLLIGHITLLYIGLCVLVFTTSNLYEKQDYNEWIFGFMINNYITERFLSTNILFNIFEFVFYLFLSGIYIYQFIIIWRCMEFFEIVKHHPTYCAVSMPPAYLSQLSLNSVNDKNDSLINISVIGCEHFKKNDIKLCNKTLDKSWLESEQKDEETERFYKSLIDINLL